MKWIIHDRWFVARRLQKPRHFDQLPRFCGPQIHQNQARSWLGDRSSLSDLRPIFTSGFPYPPSTIELAAYLDWEDRPKLRFLDQHQCSGGEGVSLSCLNSLWMKNIISRCRFINLHITLSIILTFVSVVSPWLYVAWRNESFFSFFCWNKYCLHVFSFVCMFLTKKNYSANKR